MPSKSADRSMVMSHRTTSSSEAANRHPVGSSGSGCQGDDRHGNRSHVSSWFFRPLVLLVLAVVVVAPPYVEGGPREKLSSANSERFGTQRKPLKYLVSSKDDAMLYLQKYGYFDHCKPHYRRLNVERKLGVDQIEDLEGLPTCTPLEEKEALKTLQYTFDLPATGRLDGPTRHLMQARRCGNADLVEPADAMRRRRKRSVQAASHQPSASILSNEVLQNDDDDDDANDTVRSKGRSDKRLQEKLSNVSSLEVRISQLQNAMNRSRELNISEPSITIDDYQLLIENGSISNNTRRRQQLDRQSSAEGSEPASRRKKRSVSYDSNELTGKKPNQFYDDRVKFPTVDNEVRVNWHLIRGRAESLSVRDQLVVLHMAFRMWAEVVPVKFNKLPSGYVSEADIIVAFMKESHLNCRKPFDGYGGELAHSWAAGDIHFDADDNFKGVEIPEKGISMLKVAIHEVGHVLGLLHKETLKSAMYPVYVRPIDVLDLEIPSDDRKTVQDVYGICKGEFDAVIDLVVFDESGPGYMTYFFRKKIFWVYENGNKRPRYGDPKHISGCLPLFPTSGVDAYIQLTEYTPNDEGDLDLSGEHSFIFSGEYLYRMYSNLTNASRMLPGYPKKISESFQVTPGLKPVASKIDAAYGDDSKFYLFSGDWMWACNLNSLDYPSDCNVSQPISSFFHTRGSDAFPEDVTKDISSIHYSYMHDKVVLIQGEVIYVWELSKKQTNRLLPYGYWWGLWNNICEPAEEASLRLNECATSN